MSITTLDFEDLHPLEFIVDYYAAQGVIFPGGAAAEDGPAKPHSGKIYLNPYRPEFAPTDYFNAVFPLSRQKRVSLYAGTERAKASAVFGVLHGYALNGAEVAIDGPNIVTPETCSAHFEIKTAGNEIHSVQLQMFAFDQNGLAFDPDQAIDDLEFEADPPPPIGNIKVPPANYDPWWWIKTMGGLEPPRPWGDPWLQPYVVALQAATLARVVAPKLRAEMQALAAKQGETAIQAIRAEMKRGKKQR